ncbi:hypothetical protein IAQ61_001098 [Plenodomus lingam]|uniref:uncharacterized protein n=1 Tax=Leptosphaeria maculans TaxID=5022 RepID=UPI003332BEFF|nr:hypothetical protein IAQ61_001098 [Plenodomus lingam]
MDAPSLQLNLEIRDAVVKSFATRRPVLHHLNADTSWLLQIPRPANAVKHGSRIYYNVLIDPWFVGGQSDVARWFSQQYHATESAETLLELHSDVPVFATEQAATLISSWSHFRTVTPTPTFPTHADWHDYSLPPLPTWLSISRLTAPKDSLFYHSALLITFATHPFLPNTTPKKQRPSLSIHGDTADDTHYSPSASEPAECIVYTPHGIPHQALSPIPTADPPLHTLAFLHGLHDVSISAAQQLNLGARNGLLAQRLLRAKYWVATHDEVKKGGGLVSWFLRRRVWTVQEALREVGGQGVGELEDVRFQDLGNGESRILE